ncbi:Polyol:NADP oxidoreductase [Pannonibacter phragmitetus]|uniref:Polyol:NADP oxidoreductase n=1 Tax=Pannonibacter phragmitetus TaxID=121719 RepID=A0A378ZQ86_9HYPH|nr:mannitol dehydrogenase family protein [Pannonibacter phragmitetus]SUA99436.1 Polyol:NADP oxidoreductase [Pannonibacter phragmitetus]
MPADLEIERVVNAKVGIVHLGLGAFYRAHGAIFIEEAVARSGGNWAIAGVSLQSPTTRDRMAPRNFEYTAVELGPDGETRRDVRIIRDVLVAPESPDAVLAAMASPDVKIVTLTVTEKGYCHEPSTGRLNQSHPDIQKDLENGLPVSAPGYLVRALQRRFAAGLAPFTVMTCDNLPHNGKVVRGVVLDLARLIDPALADWIEREGRFPSTMVDRIVPATKPEDIERLSAITGRNEDGLVVHEPFRQWVVEDDFVGGERPDLGAVGVELVSDVAVYEHMKLRMLNGAHSSLAYLGYLSGHKTIADTMADEALAGFVTRLWSEEIIPALTPPPGVDLAGYAAALKARFANTGIRHLTWQIAMDGSQKLPQRILSTLGENLKAGRSSPRLMLAVAAWMRYVGGVDETGAPIEVKDPLAARLRELFDSAATAEGKAAALLGVREIFDPALASQLQAPVAEALGLLLSQGARKTLQSL